MKNLLILAVIALLTASCQKNSIYIYNEGYKYSTVYHIIYESPEGKDLQNDIEVELDKFGMSLSTFNPNSIISKVNKNIEVTTDHWFEKTFQKSMEVSKYSQGAFDITVAPLVNLWGFGFEKSDTVTPAMVDSIKQFVGFESVKLENHKVVKLDNRTMLDCSAIAKGLSVDVVALFLESKGVKNYMVEIGGEVIAKGKNSEGKFWKIGINKPKDNALYDDNDLQTIIEVQNKAVATSGNYRNFYVKDGKRYAHTIDPKSGYPVQHSLLSASVLANDCMTADAYATACMVLGVDEALAMAKKVKEIDLYLIYADSAGNYLSVYTDGFKTILNRE